VTHPNSPSRSGGNERGGGFEICDVASGRFHAAVRNRFLGHSAIIF
jgi:hypothetical protein